MSLLAGFLLAWRCGFPIQEPQGSAESFADPQAFVRAAFRGHLQVVQLLREAWAEVEGHVDDNTPFQCNLSRTVEGGTKATRLRVLHLPAMKAFDSLAPALES